MPVVKESSPPKCGPYRTATAEYRKKTPMHSDPKTEGFPQKFTQRPSCGLTKQWEKQENGKTIIRYAGSDGVLYESIRGDGWTAIGRA